MTHHASLLQFQGGRRSGRHASLTPPEGVQSQRFSPRAGTKPGRRYHFRSGAEEGKGGLIVALSDMIVYIYKIDGGVGSETIHPI